MKKLLAILLALITVFSVIACQNEGFFDDLDDDDRDEIEDTDDQKVVITKKNAKRSFEKGFESVIDSDFFNIKGISLIDSKGSDGNSFYGYEAFDLNFAVEDKKPVFIITYSNSFDENTEPTVDDVVYGKGSYLYSFY